MELPPTYDDPDHRMCRNIVQIEEIAPASMRAVTEHTTNPSVHPHE